jgi:hypothetical protein
MTPETIDPILNMIENHGLSLVLLIFMISFWFIPWVKRLNKKEEIVDDYQAIIDRRESQQALTEKIFKADSEINCILSEMLAHYEAQWVTLWQFHNGVNSIAGVPFLKISATHERTSIFVSPKAHMFKDMPVSLFLDDNAYLIEKEVSSLSLIDNKVNSAIRNLMASNNAKKMFIGIVRGVNGGLIGAITMAFIDDVWLSDEDYGQIRSYSSRSAIALSNLVALNDENKRMFR